ncbi:MAG: hypothetical protein COZ18_01210 [Flexibacter sp. CG_4_10_14_3_um_filter_32_15]|nr:MAG: hypothetical protein COZ18_01210 [Flexibacter sp. CG_4_10_14_3_um_filter_32_15]
MVGIIDDNKNTQHTKNGISSVQNTDWLNTNICTRFEGNVIYGEEEGQEFLIPNSYQDVLCYYRGIIGVKKGNKWGGIDSNYKEVIPFEYDNICCYLEGLVFKKGNREFCLDNTGKSLKKLPRK